MRLQQKVFELRDSEGNKPTLVQVEDSKLLINGLRTDIPTKNLITKGDFRQGSIKGWSILEHITNLYLYKINKKDYIIGFYHGDLEFSITEIHNRIIQFNDKDISNADMELLFTAIEDSVATLESSDPPHGTETPLFGTNREYDKAKRLMIKTHGYKEYKTENYRFLYLDKDHKNLLELTEDDYKEIKPVILAARNDEYIVFTSEVGYIILNEEKGELTISDTYDTILGEEDNTEEEEIIEQAPKDEDTEIKEEQEEEAIAE